MEMHSKRIKGHTMLSFVYHTMGTVFTSQIVLDETAEKPALLTKIEHFQNLLEVYLEQINTRFSPYLADSEVSRYNRGELTALTMSPDLYFVFASSLAAKLATHDAFDANYNGEFEPSGFVKGWSIEVGFSKFLVPLFQFPSVQAVNLIGGGDMQMETREQSDWVFDIGIVDPTDRYSIIKTVQLKTGAIATSGISERGHHIKGAVDDILQTTVIGQALQEVDVWATALMVNPDLALPDNLSGFIFTRQEGETHAKIS